MALVAYENSDSSGFEDDDNEPTAVVTFNKKEEPAVSQSIPTVSKPLPDVVEEPVDSNLFNLLPRPSNKKSAIVEEDDEFLHKKENANIIKPKVKITVPSLKDFKDIEDRPVAKPKAANEKKSGLLSILPQPKNGVTISTKSLIPHVLTKKPNATAKKKGPVDLTGKSSKIETTTSNNCSDESDNDDEVQSDFFSIHKPIDTPVDIPLDTDTPSQSVSVSHQKIAPNIDSYFKQDDAQNHVELQPDYEDSSNIETDTYCSETGASYGASETSSSGNVLDDEAILKLCGTRGKRKREDIQIVDVNQEEVLADAREWLLKGLMDDTSTRVSASKRRGGEPTTQQRRKHQITYLAHQAKANEAELQNQWANNRMTKRQTQSKYGF